MNAPLLDTDKERLLHILESVALIEQLLRQPSRDRIAQLALERCFEIIGEACRHISRPLRKAYPAIPWTSIIGLRNIVTHDCDKVDMMTIWDIAEHKIPALKDWIKGILDEHNKGSKQ